MPKGFPASISACMQKDFAIIGVSEKIAEFLLLMGKGEQVEP